MQAVELLPELASELTPEESLEVHTDAVYIRLELAREYISDGEYGMARLAMSDARFRRLYVDETLLGEPAAVYMTRRFRTLTERIDAASPPEVQL